MTKLEIFLEIIREMNIDLLQVFLDDDKSYMNVPKQLFIEQLSIRFHLLKSKGIDHFSNISKGTCQKCFKGCSGYSFLTNTNDYLDLLIIEKDNDIEDIFQCSELKNDNTLLKEKKIYMSFKKDLHVNYIPTAIQQTKIKNIQQAEFEFKKFENTIITFDDLEIWVNKWAKLFSSVKGMNWNYKFVCSFIHIYFSVKDILLLKYDKDLAQKALSDFELFNVSDEQKLINWLLKYQRNELFHAGSNYSTTENWKKTNLVIFKNHEDILNDGFKFYENIIIDITGCNTSALFVENYSHYYYELYYLFQDYLDENN